MVVKWEPLNHSGCDTLLRYDDGREVWHGSAGLRPADDAGPLPLRSEVRRLADGVALQQLREIRAQHVRDFREPWPGVKHGKAILGQSIDGAISEIQQRLNPK